MRRALPLAILVIAPLLLTCGGGSGGGGAAPTELTITTAGLADATAGQPYQVEVRAAGGVGTGRSFRVVSGALPGGLSLQGGAACVPFGSFQTVFEVDPDTQGGTQAGTLTEISGLAASRRNPGIVWVHDDGNRGVLHAIGADGTRRQSYLVDTPRVDWEDLAMGPGPDANVEYLYVGDIGDNGGSRAHINLVRVVEPIVPATPGATISLSFETFALVYPDGPRDAEALIVDWDTGTPYVIDKRDEGGAAYRVPLPLDTAWTPASPGVMVAATTGRPLPATITGAGLGRDGRRLLVRSYFDGAELARAADAPFEAIFTATPCSVSLPIAGQYEAIGYAADGTGAWTTTEFVLGSSVPFKKATAGTDAGRAEIQGTPGAAGTFTVEIEVRDASGARAQRTFELVVQP